MEKEIILLAKSAKKHNYCTAGIDAATGEWVRIISENAAVQHAVSVEEMKYEDGNLPEIMDVVSIQCKRHSPCDYQPENYVLDDEYYWTKLREATLKEVVRIRPPEDKDSIFYNADKRIACSEISSVPIDERQSLMLVSPECVTIQIKQWPNKANKTLTASFRYNGDWYNYVSITDPVVWNYFRDKDEGQYKITESLLFVMSLADAYSEDGHHYKLIATVLGNFRV